MKAWKKFVCVLLAAALAACAVPALAAPAAWDGQAADTAWYDAAKAEYVLSTPAQLAGLAALVNSGTDFANKTVALGADMDLGGHEWTPIGMGTRGTPGANDHYFTGTFDGQGHSILNLSVSMDLDQHGAGLFGAVQNAVIRNVNIASGNVANAPDAAAGIVAIVTGDANSTTSIENCTNAAGVSGAAAGGIVGRAYGQGAIYVIGCENTGTITTTEKAGGIVGINNNAGTVLNVSRCVNRGAVTGGNAGAAGILGYGNKGAVLENCENTGAIGDASTKYAGGIVGYASQGVSVLTGCENTGAVTGTANAGGIVGICTDEWSLNGCRNAGDVQASAGAAGGIAGGMQGGLLNACANTGAVSAPAGAAGGVAGAVGTTVVNACTGGTAQVTGSMPGRLLGTVANGPAVWAVLNLTASSQDAHENGLKDVHTLSPNTSWGELVVTGGTLNGLPAVGASGQGVLHITDSAACSEAVDGAAKGLFTAAKGGAWQTVTNDHVGSFDMMPDAEAVAGGTKYATLAAAQNSGAVAVAVLKATGDIAATGTATLVNATGAAITVNGAAVAPGAQATGTHNLTAVEASPATCTANGNIAYWKCEACGKYFADSGARQEIGYAGTVVLATGHTYQNGVCTVCGAAQPGYTAPQTPQQPAATGTQAKQNPKTGV